MEEVYRDQGVVALPANNTGAQMGGWFRKEIRSSEDLKGLKFRIGGTGGMVLQRLGVIAQQLGAGDIYPALERGVIDGAEWVGPHDDEKLGFHRVAQFYYYPGWWEPCSEGDFMVNIRAWDALPKQYQQVLEAVVGETNVWSMSRYDTLNVQALRRLVAGGAQLRPYPREVLTACHKAAQETYAELGDATRASSASTRTGTASAATPRPGSAWPRTAAPTSSRSPSACSEGRAAAGGALPPAAPSSRSRCAATAAADRRSDGARVRAGAARSDARRGRSPARSRARDGRPPPGSRAGSA